MFIRHVLVATDFSDRSRAAQRYAVRLAEALSAEIDVLHVIPPPRTSAVVIDAYLGRHMPEVDPGLVADAQRKLERFIASVPHGAIRVRQMIEPGDPAATIVRMATELPSDLIIVGTHARTGLAELVLGSVARSVLTCAPCPVLALRGDQQVGPG